MEVRHTDYDTNPIESDIFEMRIPIEEWDDVYIRSSGRDSEDPVRPSPARLRRVPGVFARWARGCGLSPQRSRGLGLVGDCWSRSWGALLHVDDAHGSDLGEGNLGALVVLGSTIDPHAASLVRLPELLVAARIQRGRHP